MQIKVVLDELIKNPLKFLGLYDRVGTPACEQHLKPIFGFYKLKNLKSSIIQGVYNKLLKNGRLDGKGGLSQKTIQNIHRVFRKALQLAYINDMIAKNPAGEGRITLPKQSVKKK